MNDDGTGRASMGDLIPVVIFGLLVAIVAVAGVKLGMLLAPRIDRLTEPGDEERRADDD
jgi:hypothetical protein